MESSGRFFKKNDINSILRLFLLNIIRDYADLSISIIINASEQGRP